VKEPRWVSRLVVDIIHFEQLREHGGLQGIGDENALESALSRPQHKYHYDKAIDLAALAAAYCYGIARSNCYRDGNKRTAFVTMVVFLGLNGLDLVAEERDVVKSMLATAAGTQSEEDLAQWCRERSVHR
jgi:death-on-curing protein